VYTDNIGDPSPGKAQFSLASFLSDRLSAGRMQVQVTKLSQGFSLQIGPLPPPPSRTPQTAVAKVPPGRRYARLYLFGGAIAIAAASILFLARPRREPRRPFTMRGEFLVTEASRRSGDEQSEIFSRDRRVPFVQGVPAVFSTDADSATYVVAAAEGASMGELFRLTLESGGFVRIESQHAELTVNGVLGNSGNRSTASLREPLVIGLTRRQFTITAVFETPRAIPHRDGVFRAEPLHD
jgi:hypothetical protein